MLKHFCMLLVIAALALLPASMTRGEDVVRVFILAGQSNMEGKAANKLLDYQATAPETKDFYAKYRTGDEWTVRDDVFIKFLDRKGPLTIGYGSPDKTGLELAFGHAMGEKYDEPVLLIKAAWGGKSIMKDFRSPSAGLPSDEYLANELKGQQEGVKRNNERNNRNEPLPTMDDVKAGYGVFYKKMMEEINSTLANLDQEFPELAGKQPKLEGFVWFQGFNDKFGGQDFYAANMEALIKDVRSELNAPKLPVVIGLLGQNGSKPADGTTLTIQEAQLAMEQVPEFKGNVKAVPTDVLVDKKAEELIDGWQDHVEEWNKVGSDRGYHYYGSGIWFTRIGEALGNAMLELKKD